MAGALRGKKGRRSEGKIRDEKKNHLETSASDLYTVTGAPIGELKRMKDVQSTKSPGKKR